MRHVLCLLFVVIAPALASAQQAQQQQSAQEQALGNKLMQEIGTGLQCQSALITAQRELEELKKKHADEKPNAPPPGK